ncbi:MAG: hypothetical protein P8J84_06455 [Paracoccaceae bacterium]|nr:hypothetical protein [Paracoccaceae bacterium]
MTNPGAVISIKAISGFAKAFRKNSYPEHLAQMKNNIARISGLAKMIVANPVMIRQSW